MKYVALAALAALVAFIVVPTSYAAPACCAPGQNQVPGQPLLNVPQAAAPQAAIPGREFMPQAYARGMISAAPGGPGQMGAGCCGGQGPACFAPAAPSCCASAGPACGCSGARGAMPTATGVRPQAMAGPKRSQSLPDCCAPGSVKPVPAKGPGQVKSDAPLIAVAPLSMGKLVPATAGKSQLSEARALPAGAIPARFGQVTLW
jgi:hypothetical protein